jgi:hypothetical protein
LSTPSSSHDPLEIADRLRVGVGFHAELSRFFHREVSHL